jgi:hypothetical protein
LPIWRIGADGQPQATAQLVPLAGGQHWIEPWQGSGFLFEGLPPVIQDMATQGYLGRRFSDAHPDLNLPRRLQDWNDEHALIAVARRGEDCIGDLVIGEESLDRFLAAEPEAVSRDDYPLLAREPAVGGAGSSAGGERPKFAAFVAGRHVLLKFTAGDGSPSDQRWRDLLISESIALDLLHDRGIQAAQAEAFDIGAQRFLEVERFDRIGASGRRGVLTLGPLDDDLYGRRDSWTDAGVRLHRDSLLSREDAARIQLLDAFGELIGNGDRHFGNISFFADELVQYPSLVLAPAYDMLPMVFAPHAGFVPEIRLPPPRPRARLLEAWDEANDLAQQYWKCIEKDERISKAFRAPAPHPAPWP